MTFRSSNILTNQSVAFAIAKRFTALAMLAIVIAGCSDPLDVSRHMVPKVKTPPPGDRLLAAMVPIRGQAWFFKMSGRKDQVEAQTGAFHKLLKSLKLKDGEPEWSEVPEGWTEEPASGMRKATFVIDKGDEFKVVDKYSANSAAPRLECTVIALPSTNVLANINRWRKQVGLASLLPDELNPETGGTGELNQFELSDGTQVTWVNLEGNMIGGSGPPFAGMAGMGPMQGGGGGMPANHPPAQTKTEQGPPPGPIGPSGPVEFREDSISAMSYEIPTHWQLAPPRRFREKTWNIKTAGRDTEASISSLPAAPSADLTANINRWRGQLRLQGVSKKQVDDSLQPFEIDGVQGHFTKIQGSQKSIVGVIVMHGQKGWFLKLFGDSELTDFEETNFVKFLKSIKFR